MAEDHPPPSTEPPLQTHVSLLPPPFMRLPFAQMPPPSFWPMQDYHAQFLGIRSPLPPAPQISDQPDLQSHSTHFAAPDFPPPHANVRPPAAMFSLLASLTSHTPPAGLQLFTESPESSLLDPHTSPPPRGCEQQQPTVKETSHTHHQNSAAAAMAEQRGEYPPPLASHQEVVAKKHLFYDTLSKLLAHLAIKPRVPKVGGKELDLHTLYREVTTHGGLKQAAKLNRWRDIIAALNLPARVSSPSFFVRKHYANLLYHYEQVYFFRIEGKMIPLPAAENLEPAKKRRRRKFNTIETPGVDPGKSVGRNVTGAIEGKFEHGYLVTVVVGTEKMRGVLYHVHSENDTPQFAAALPELVNKLSSTSNSLGMRRRRSKNGNYRKKDPNAPRSSRSGYNYFFAEQRSKLKDYRPAKRTEITKIIGELWHRLTPEERTPYLERGQTDKDRYRKEKKEYQEALKMQAELKHETDIQAHLESLDDSVQGFEQLEQDDDDDDADHENDSDHDYHVSLDADLDTGAFNLSQEQGLRTQMFGDFVPDDQIEYGQDEGYEVSEARDADQQQGVYVAPTEDYEDEEDDDEDGVDEDDDGDGDDNDDDDDGDENEVGEDDG